MNNNMKVILVPIQSSSDIITNSSSEVFIINTNNGSIKELISKIKTVNNCIHDIFYFENEDTLISFLNENFFNYDVITSLSEVLDWNPIMELTYGTMHGENDYKSYKLNINEIVSSLLPIYKTLIGKIMIIIDNHYELTSDIEDIISDAKKNNLIEYFDVI
jgi:hypothetical protein